MHHPNEIIWFWSNTHVAWRSSVTLLMSHAAQAMERLCSQRLLSQNIFTRLDMLGVGSSPTPRNHPHPRLPPPGPAGSTAHQQSDTAVRAGSEDKQRISTANKARVRMLQCVIMALDRNPVEFAAFLPPFLSLYSTNALTAPDAAGVYALPAKRRVLLTTFLARALVCPHFEPDMIGFIKMKGGGPRMRRWLAA